MRLSAIAALTAGLLTCASAARSDIRLQYDDDLRAAGFPSPMLRGTLGGQPAWFIVDTGAGVHTLASWMAKAARVPTKDTGSKTTGSTGVETVVPAFADQVVRTTDDVDIHLTEGIVVDFPPVFEQYRIGGLISPQLLASSTEAAVLDLRAPSLSIVPGDAAAREAGVAVKDARVCVNAASQFANRVYAAPMIADGLHGSMLVDTGATGSVAASASPIAAALARRASQSGSTQGVGGAAVASRKVPDVVLQADGGRTVVALSIDGAAPSCGRDGLLGMDALRDCVLALGRSTFAWRCGTRR